MNTLIPAPQSPEQAPPPRSAVEGVKEASCQLRGTLAEEVASASDHLSEASKTVIKFHGSYQQEDRDARKNRKRDGVGKHYMFMVRCRIPGGRLTAAQYLAVDDLAGRYANGTLRFTTRQGIQLHGVLKKDLKQTIAGINACLLTTLGACGDVNRNVMACPAPHHDGVRAQLQETAALIAAHLAPRTRAYHEIWLNGKPVENREQEEKETHGLPPVSFPFSQAPPEEPLYGKTYLPRKFKTGIALPEDNCIDVHAQDLGLLAVVEGGQVVGYNVLVGGGMGMTHGNANTFPHLAKPICYVPAQAVVGTAEAVVKLFRDHGNRADRKRARIKYLVHDWGVEKFREVLSGYVGAPLLPPRPVAVGDFDAHLGWHPQGDGKWFFGLSVENGRVKDEGELRLRSALRALVTRFTPELRITPLQDVLLCGLTDGDRAEVERILAEHGVIPPERLSNVQKYSMACPAVPTCGLAISESERALPGVIDRLEVELRRLGLEDERIGVRMTGCPNGCARPYQSDIGLVGRSGDKYTVFVGGRVQGDRLNFVLRDLVPLAQVVPTLVPLLEDFKRHRGTGESFGDYCHRRGADHLHALLPEAPARGANGNGNGHAAPAFLNGSHARPDTRRLSLELTPPEVRALPAPPLPEAETLLAGPPGEELRDATFRYNSDGSVRSTSVYFYAGDARAFEAAPGAALRREAIYAGRADPRRLHAARKLSDTYYVGPAGHERRDRTVEYRPDGTPARTTLHHYADGARAAEAPSGAAVRKQVTFDGLVD